MRVTGGVDSGCLLCCRCCAYFGYKNAPRLSRTVFIRVRVTAAAAAAQLFTIVPYVRTNLAERNFVQTNTMRKSGTCSQRNRRASMLNITRARWRHHEMVAIVCSWIVVSGEGRAPEIARCSMVRFIESESVYNLLLMKHNPLAC